MRRIVLASGNRGKLAEMRALLTDLDCELLAQNELGIVDPEETGQTFIENALLKARHAAALSGLPALADDSGLLVDALAGAPGLITAHYAGVHGDAERNIAKLLAELAGRRDRRASFYSVIVFLRSPTDARPLIAEGEWRGEILDAPRGIGGFGYDPIFLDPELGQSAAELSAGIKNARSHRGRALCVLKNRLRESWSPQT